MFKVSIEQIDKEQDEEVIIKTHEINEEVLALMKKLQEGQVKATTIVGQKGEKIYSVKLKDILYIEAIDNKTFIYCESEFYESKLKLYELEEIVKGHSFFRCSKSVIMHCSKIDCVTPAFNGRFEARMINGERVMISRQYVPELKKMLGI